MVSPSRRPTAAGTSRALRLVLVAALALGLAISPSFAPPVAAASITTTDHVASCEANLRSSPSLGAAVADVIGAGVVVSVDAVVTGDAWSAPLPR